MIIVYIILGLIAIGICLALLDVALRFIGILIGITIIPGLITLFLFGNFWVGAVIGVIIAIWRAISKQNKKNTCSHCESLNTEECPISQELLNSIQWEGGKAPNAAAVTRILKCNDCGGYTVFY